MAIKNVIFDLGKVLIRYDFNIFYKKLGYKENERSLDEADEPILLFESGKISKYDFFEEMKYIYDFDIPLEIFEKIWCEVFFEIKEMINLAEKISKKFNVYICSNTDEIHFPYIWNKFPSLHFFGNNQMLSYKLNSVKPEPEIYLNALKKFILIPEECVFIDDKSPNVIMSEQIGMTGIIHNNYEETREKLSHILNMNLENVSFKNN